jgi:hypothetical protein
MKEHLTNEFMKSSAELINYYSELTWKYSQSLKDFCFDLECSFDKAYPGADPFTKSQMLINRLLQEVPSNSQLEVARATQPWSKVVIMSFN